MTTWSTVEETVTWRSVADPGVTFQVLRGAVQGGGAVDSVNAQTGTVVLDAGDVGAVPASRTITAGAGLTGGGDLSADRTLAQVSAGAAVAVSAVDGTATTFHVIVPSPGAAAVAPIPAGWVDSGAGPLPVTYLPAGGIVVRPGDSALGEPFGLFRIPAGGATSPWESLPLAIGQVIGVGVFGSTVIAGTHAGAVVEAIAGDARIDGVDSRIDGVDADLAAVTGHAGSGLFAHVSGPDLWDMAEGTLDRWKSVAAFSTTNVDLSVLVGVPVPTQPTLDGGVAPPASTNSAVWLFGQTTAAENGCYIVSAGSDGHWTHQVNPTTFDPPGNSYEVHVSAPGTAIDGVWFEWLDDSPEKWMRAAQQPGFTPEEPFVASTSGRWFRHPRPTRTLTADPVIPVSVVDAKGDVLVGTAADSVSRLGVGTNGQVLTADSGEAAGVKWAAAASGVHTYTGALPSANVAYSNLGTFANTTAHPLTAVNRRCWVPIYLPSGTFTRIAIYPWTSGNASTWRLGLHADSGGWPGALLADFGTVSTSSASLQAVTISQTVTAGWYWAQIQVDAYTATPNVMCVSGLTAHPVMPLGFPTDIASGSRGLAAMYDALGTGGALAAAPASLTAASLFASAPRVWVYIP